MTEVGRLELTEDHSSADEPRTLFYCEKHQVFKSNEKKKFRAEKINGLEVFNIRKNPKKSKFERVRTSYHLTDAGLILYYYLYLYILKLTPKRLNLKHGILE